jgi:hypothetical protein
MRRARSCQAGLAFAVANRAAAAKSCPQSRHAVWPRLARSPQAGHNLPRGQDKIQTSNKGPNPSAQIDHRSTKLIPALVFCMPSQMERGVSGAQWTALWAWPAARSMMTAKVADHRTNAQVIFRQRGSSRLLGETSDVVEPEALVMIGEYLSVHSLPSHHRYWVLSLGSRCHPAGCSAELMSQSFLELAARLWRRW